MANAVGRLSALFETDHFTTTESRFQFENKNTFDTFPTKHGCWSTRYQSSIGLGKVAGKNNPTKIFSECITALRLVYQRL